ncbi:MAG: DUF3473 domain-containing protein [Sphingomonadales bacterium]
MAAERVPARRDDDGRVINAMSVDVEEYFQVGAFETCIKREDWPRFESRVVANTESILELFAAHDVKATFFCLGWVAERHAGLLRAIVDAGHEVASHGYDHRRVFELDPKSFAADLARTKAILEDCAGQPVIGYRAPSFSIGENNAWALDVLADQGYAYSSSIYPIRHDHYGMPSAPRFAFRHGADGMIEIPLTTVKWAGRTLPCSGGGYFRLLPYRLSRAMMRRVNAQDEAACMFYFHPWEVDPDQPRQHQAPWKSRFRHYTNLARMRGKLDHVLRDFRWDRVDRVFLPAAAG